jgi:hypothetical protein
LCTIQASDSAMSRRTVPTQHSATASAAAFMMRHPSASVTQ